MDHQTIESLKNSLMQRKSRILSGLLNQVEDLKIDPEDLSDEADLANNLIQQHLSFQMRNNDLSKLRQIEESLRRITEGTYGLCLECDEEIGESRLDKYPWASLCIHHAEELERKRLL